MNPKPRQKKGVNDELLDMLADAWGIIANAGESDWGKESKMWREAAIRWRDKRYFPLLDSLSPTKTKQ